jgi:hypothetical protein
MKTKTKFREFINEINSYRNRYIPVKEETMPKGFFSSAEMAKQYNTVHRVSQRWISELMSEGKLEVLFVRRTINKVFVKRIPVYKFKTKAYEKSFKSRLKRKQRAV